MQSCPTASFEEVLQEAYLLFPYEFATLQWTYTGEHFS
jgi:hypothetical protein